MTWRTRRKQSPRIVTALRRSPASFASLSRNAVFVPAYASRTEVAAVVYGQIVRTADPPPPHRMPTSAESATREAGRQHRNQFSSHRSCRRTRDRSRYRAEARRAIRRAGR